MPIPESGNPRLRHDPKTALVLLVAMNACFAYLFFRNTGLVVLGPDEWLYSQAARLLPITGTRFTEYLYQLLYRSTNTCGSGFMECARFLNSAFLLAAMPLIYLVAKRVATRPLAIVVALLAVLGPVNLYTALFMPESMYFFGFWVLAWYALREPCPRPLIWGLGLGVVLGSMALIKTHAIFLVPAGVLFAALKFRIGGREHFLRSGVLASVSLIVSASVVRFGFGYLIAGNAGLSLFGQFYGSLAPSLGDASHDLQFASKTMVSLGGHAMGLAALFSLPLAALFWFPMDSREAHEPTLTASRNVRLFTALVLANLVAVTTLFTAHVAGGAVETVARLHMRYYLFAFPLLLVIAAEQATTERPRQFLRIVPALLTGLAAICAIAFLLDFYTPGIVDSPELWGISVTPKIFTSMVLLGLTALALWLVNTRLGARLFLFGFFPAVVFLGNWRTNDRFSHLEIGDKYSDAGTFAQQYLGGAREPVLVVANNHSSAYRTLFYLDNPKAVSLILPAFDPIPATKVPSGTKWLLIVGAQTLPENAQWEAGYGEITLARLGGSGQRELDFTKKLGRGVTAIGLSRTGAWGTWSDGYRVEIRFSHPLPEAFDLVINARTIRAEPVEVIVGDQHREFRLPVPGEVSLSFSTDGNQRSILFEIPWAKTFRELGIINMDPRRLGIGFRSIRIVEPASLAGPGHNSGNTN